MLGVARPISSIAVQVCEQSLRATTHADAPAGEAPPTVASRGPVHRSRSPGPRRPGTTRSSTAAPPRRRRGRSRRGERERAPIRSAGPSSTSFVSSERSTSPTALRQTASSPAADPKLRTVNRPSCSATDGSRLTQDRCESVLVPSNRRHGSDDNRTLSGGALSLLEEFPDRSGGESMPEGIGLGRPCQTYPNGQDN